jgi:glycerophosphoryl diester phosphodiesterase
MRTTLCVGRTSRIGTLAAVGMLALSTGCSLEGQREEHGVDAPDDSPAKLLVAHRGASAYAPEHTRPAYELALAQGADYLEPDLQVTRDGVLIAFHDLTLERTTDVAEVFPDRYREETADGRTVRRWYVADFTLEEVRRLDAGSWFDAAFRGERVMTLSEVIDAAMGKAGIFPETKSPEFYRARGFDMERLLLDELARHGLDRPGAVPGTPVLIQSFSPGSLRTLRELGTELPLTLLVSGSDAETWLSREGLERAREFADGIGPSKGLLLATPEVVGWAREAGLTVVPYTFRAQNPGGFPDVTAEMAHFLYELGVDGLFTDNPDLFPRTPPPDAR